MLSPLLEVQGYRGRHFRLAGERSFETFCETTMKGQPLARREPTVENLAVERVPEQVFGRRTAVGKLARAGKLQELLPFGQRVTNRFVVAGASVEHRSQLTMR